MIFEIEVSEQADRDLRNIYEYIAFELQSPENAAGQLNRLEESIMGLDQVPERFREYENEPWHSRGLRIMPVVNYCVFYIPDAEYAVITIIRVMYGGRDIDAQLKKYTNQKL
ncbi:type II toxin-antitoxin system RelE/ParE family toxin [Dielma fastidiosa]|uniref:type II toxin-antitoxin system RelE/ParE family toxin n=1 Tax=Dielma fastidiosa TaxID=1034346 RepID=UPI00356B5154